MSYGERKIVGTRIAVVAAAGEPVAGDHHIVHYCSHR
jgi:hypothetical protein